MSSYPFVADTNVFNTNDYNILEGGLTLETANRLYLSLSGGVLSGSLNILGTLSINSSLVDLSALSGLTAGTVTASKLVLVDANKDISGFRNITLSSAITSSGGSNSTPLSLTNTSSSSNFQVRIDSVSGNIDLRNNNSSDITLLSLYSNGNRQLTCINNANIVNLPLHNGSSSGLSLAGTLVTATANELNYLSGLTAGTAAASKALVLNSSSNITGINDLTCNNLTASTSIGTPILNANSYLLGGSSLLMSALTSVTAGTASASKALIVDSSRNINSINSISLNGSNDVITLTNATASARTSIRFINDAQSWEFGSRGSANAPNSNLYLYNNTLANFAFTVGTDSVVDISTGLKLGGTLVTSTAAELNYVDVTTIGTAQASKALVVDASKNITSLNNITTNTILIVSRSSSGQSFNSTNGTTSCVLYHFNNGIPYFGTTGTTDFILQTNGTERFRINGTTGDITGISALTATNLTGTLQTAAQPNVTSTGNLTLPSSLTITNGSTPLNLTNTGSTSNFRLTIDGASGNIDLKNNNASNTTLISLFANGTRQLTCINNANLVNIPNHNGSTAGLQLGGTLITSTATELNYVDVTTIGTAQASKALVLDSNRDIYNIDDIGCRAIDPTNNISLAYKSILRKNSQSQGDGLEVYDTQFHSTDTPCLNILAANSDSPLYVNLYNYNYGNFRIYHQDASGSIGEGMTFKYFRNTGVSALNSNCVQFRAPNDEIQISLNDYNTTNPNVLFHPTSWVNDYQPNYSTTDFKAIFCKSVLMKKALMLSTSTSSSLDPSAQCCITGSSTYVDGSYNKTLRCLGANASPVEFQVQCNSGTNATSTNAVWMGTISTSDLRFGVGNSTKAILDTNGYFGIGTTTPSCGLHVAVAGNSVTTAIGIGTNTYFYNISSDTWTNGGGGPYVATLCARFSSNVWIQDKLYATSDKRLKEEIKPLDFELEHYEKLNPVSYKWKNDKKVMLGLLAQEAKDICAESINIVENENMKEDEENKDMKGLQYTMDYNAIHMMSVVAIKKLIKKINILEEKLKRNNIE